MAVPLTDSERGALQRYVDMSPPFEVEQLARDQTVAIFANNRASLLLAVPWLERTILEEIDIVEAARPCWLAPVEGIWAAGTQRILPAPPWWTVLCVAYENGLRAKVSTA